MISNLLASISICLLVGWTSCQTYSSPECYGKQVIVHLFEWKWRDVAAECERFLATAGFCGVQVSPPNEYRIITSPERPWWERYQPVSYILESRSGSREEFVDMVERCNVVGVRIFVDAVINHMVDGTSSGVGTAGSTYSGVDKDFPAVPYDEAAFTPTDLCTSDSGNVNDFDDSSNVRYCNLLGLLDLYGESEYVQQTIADYLNDLISIGVAGFRVDAAKYMWPEDLDAIMDLTDNLNTDQGFPSQSRPFFYNEVTDLTYGAVQVQEYYDLGKVTEFRYSQRMTAAIEDFVHLEGIYEPYIGMADTEYALVFVDNHDNQRGHGGDYSVVTYQTPHEYRLAVAFTLAQPYGFTRIMSSYDFGNDTDAGPPHNDEFEIDDVVIGENNQCSGEWVCEHRWPSIYKMVQFRNAVRGTYWNNYFSDDNICSFSRGNIGFFVMVKSGTINQTTFSTNLTSGLYQELISCQEVQIFEDGTVIVSISNEEEPVFAICNGCFCNGNFSTTEMSTVSIGATNSISTESSFTTTSTSERTSSTSTTDNPTSSSTTDGTTLTTNDATSTSTSDGTTNVTSTSTTGETSESTTYTTTTESTTYDSTTTSTAYGTTSTTDIASSTTTSTSDGTTNATSTSTGEASEPTTSESTTYDSTTTSTSDGITSTTDDASSTSTSDGTTNVTSTLTGETSESTTYSTTPESTTPESTTYSTTPESTTYSTTPESTTHSTTPESTTHSTTPESTTHSTTPESTTHSTTPESTTHRATPESTTHSTTPESTTHSTTPESTTHSTTPESTTHSTTPESTTHSTTPESTTHSTTPESTTYNSSTTSTSDGITSTADVASSTTTSTSEGTPNVTYTSTGETSESTTYRTTYDSTTASTTDRTTIPSSTEFSSTTRLETSSTISTFSTVSTTITSTIKTTTIPDEFRRTTIFLYKETNVGEFVFVRGRAGSDTVLGEGCTSDISTDPCAIDIITNSLGITEYYDSYNAWRIGDSKLDWFGSEPEQGSYNGEEALGTATAWTSNDETQDGYQELNDWGDHYWMVDMYMNCSQTEDRWFEVIGYLTGNEAEQGISSQISCTGSIGGLAPNSYQNHVGKCGYINKFEWNSNRCVINAYE